jgi:hypothetical protein
MNMASETPRTDALNAKFRPYIATECGSYCIDAFDTVMDDMERAERELAQVKAERDGLRKHASAMHDYLSCECSSMAHNLVIAYRADFPAPDTPKE